jgi:hypothetical protein
LTKKKGLSLYRGKKREKTKIEKVVAEGTPVRRRRKR